MARTTSKSKKLKKNNVKQILSAVVLIALVVLVPLAMFLIKKSTDNRSQASTPSSPENSYFYLNTSKSAAYLSTHYGSNNFTLDAGKTYYLISKLIPYNLGDKGLQIALVCNLEKCHHPDGRENVVNKHEWITEIKLTNSSLPATGLGKEDVFRGTPIRFTKKTYGYQVRIFASDGTEVALNNVGFLNSEDYKNKVVNGEFTTVTDRAIQRFYPKNWSEKTSYANEYAVRPQTDPANNTLIVRGRTSPGIGFTTGNLSGTHNSVLFTTFTAPSTANYVVYTKATQLKKRLGTGPNEITATARVYDVATNQPVGVPLNFNNGTATAEQTVSLTQGKTYELRFESIRGSEWDIDTLGVKNSGPATQADSFISPNPFFAETRDVNVVTRQAASWIDNTADYNLAYSYAPAKDTAPVGTPLQFPIDLPEVLPTQNCRTTEVEPNNNSDEMLPNILCINTEIRGRFNSNDDQGVNKYHDLYRINAESGKKIKVTLNNSTDNVLQVKVWDVDRNAASTYTNAFANTIVENISDSNTTAKYIQVFRSEGSSTRWYTLSWEYVD